MSQRPGSSAGGRKAGGAQRVRPSPSAPGDSAQVDGIEREGADVDVGAGRVGGDLLREGALGAAGRAPEDRGLAGLDEQRERRGELARAQGVVGGDRVGHGQAPGWRKSGAVRTPLAPDRSPAGSAAPLLVKRGVWRAPEAKGRRGSRRVAGERRPG